MAARDYPFCGWAIRVTIFSRRRPHGPLTPRRWPPARAAPRRRSLPRGNPLDTRIKIRPAAQAAALRHQAAEQKRPLRVATGHFDPLLVEHARLLGEFARPEAWLVVVVTPSRNPLLVVRARAELVASLAVVEYVLAAADAGEAERVLADLEPEAVLRWDSDDERRTAELIAHVHSRY